MGFLDNMLKVEDDEYDEYDEDEIKKEKKDKKENDKKVIVIAPRTIEDGNIICDNLLKGYTIVIKLIDLDENMSQRITDFTSGACYSINGKLQKITPQILIAAPKTTDLTGDFVGSLEDNRRRQF